MSATDELRVCARAFLGVWVDNASQTITFTTSDVPPTADSIRMDSRLLAIADRIDKAYEESLQREHETAYDEGYDEGFASADDTLSREENGVLAEHGFVRLPKDADGEYIHIGDRMESGDGDVFIVSSVDYGLHSSHGRGKFWMLWNEDADFYERACECRHHKQPTVEDVLDEFASAYDRIGGEDEEHQKYLNLIAEYAAKLRLAGDAE